MESTQDDNAGMFGPVCRPIVVIRESGLTIIELELELERLTLQ